MPQVPENFQQEERRALMPAGIPPETASRNLASEMMYTLEKAISEKEISESAAFDCFMRMDSIDELQSSKKSVAIKLYALCEGHEDLAAIYGEAFNIFKRELLKKHTASHGMWSRIRDLIY